eukprot:gb/GECG01004066.1/.p1 GENE.gb/GECG01004066.1/~~gb/GECG01004066.1/.p1  ORF type:complete len:609 (+),score=64.30 gb/GECG01004066.1/:1-1827(+)
MLSKRCIRHQRALFRALETRTRRAKWAQKSLPEISSSAFIQGSWGKRGLHGYTISSTESYTPDAPSKVRRTFADANGEVISPWHDVPFRVATDVAEYNDDTNPSRGETDSFDSIFDDEDEVGSHLPRTDDGNRDEMIQKGTGSLLHNVCTNPKHQERVVDVAYFEPYNPLYYTTDTSGNRRLHLVPPRFHIGFVPQTYAHPLQADPLVGQDLRGNNAALQTIDLSDKNASSGDVYALQILGAVGVTDPHRSRIQWVLLGARPTDKLVEECRPNGETTPDITNASSLTKRRVEDIKHWLVTQRLHENGPELPLAARGKVFSALEAMDIARRHNEGWCEYVLRDRIHEFQRPKYGYENLSLALEKPWRPPIGWEPYQSPYLPPEYRYKLTKPRDPLDYYTSRTQSISQDETQATKELSEGSKLKASNEGPETRRGFADLSEDFGERVRQTDPRKAKSSEEADMVVLESLMREAPLHIHRMAVIRLAAALPAGGLPSSDRILYEYQQAMSLAGGSGGFVEEADSSGIRSDVSEPGMSIHGHEGVGPNTPRTSLERDAPLARAQIHEAMMLETRQSGKISPRIQGVREMLLKASPQPDWFNDNIPSQQPSVK